MVALAIFTTVTVIYLGNFFLLAHEFLKVPAPPQTISVSIRLGRLPGERSLNDLNRRQIDAFIRAVQTLERESWSKVNWKEEGF